VLETVLWGSPSLVYSGYQGPFPWGKRPGREADYSPPYSAKVKNAWICTSTPEYTFIVWCSVKKKSTGTTYLWDTPCVFLSFLSVSFPFFISLSLIYSFFPLYFLLLCSFLTAIFSLPLFPFLSSYCLFITVFLILFHSFLSFSLFSFSFIRSPLPLSYSVSYSRSFLPSSCLVILSLIRSLFLVLTVFLILLLFRSFSLFPSFHPVPPPGSSSYVHPLPVPL